jgi:uncharacterized protein YcbK (DUF882 family)
VRSFLWLGLVVSSVFTTRETGIDPALARGGLHASRKGAARGDRVNASDHDHALAIATAEGFASTVFATMPPVASPVLATLVQVHSHEHAALEQGKPTLARFSELLRDRVTGQAIAMDPRLLGLLRTLASEHPLARIELVSGFRNPKINEAMRKKGHHVASHSQHSLGFAVDFRLFEADATTGIAPRELEKEIRATGWQGGIGTYPLKTDWFVHADVGANRRWGD